MAKYSEEKGENKMCELLDYVENRGIQRGEERGEKRGIESNLISNLKSLTETLKLTIDQAMDALKVPEDKRDYYRKAVQ
jgi:predicted transposase YdaD